VKVFLLGRDGVGWSVDRDRESTARALTASGHRLARTPFGADAVWCVWWNLLLGRRWRGWIGRKPVVAVVTNDLEHQSAELERALPIVDTWVAANHTQRESLIARGVLAERIHVNPFYVEEDTFRPLEAGREELAREAGADPARFLIGSFQRDSLGADLTRPKWQKGPELLVELLEQLPADRIEVVLAGPRRHWIRAELRRRGIRFAFVGDEVEGDDIATNNLPTERINRLWNLIDLYVVTSRSEGGPKAPVEAALTGTPIISTPVGMDRDLVPAELQFETAEQGATLAASLMDGGIPPVFDDFRTRVRELNAFDAYRARIDAALSETVARSRA
jgi:glycosyltransferase involved in cell wall biosynthesis